MRRGKKPSRSVKPVAVLSAGGHAKKPPRSAQHQQPAPARSCTDQHPLTNLDLPWVIRQDDNGDHALTLASLYCDARLAILPLTCRRRLRLTRQNPIPLPPKTPLLTRPSTSISKEQVAIAAEPFDTAEKCKIFQVDYLKYRFLPIRIIVTNTGDHPISLRDARIFFISAQGDKIPAADPEDVERRVKPKDSARPRYPCRPHQVHTKGSASDDKIEADFDHFEYAALAVEPHTTRAGFLFYDMQGLGDTPLHGGKLVLRELRDSNGNRAFLFRNSFRQISRSKAVSSGTL